MGHRADQVVDDDVVGRTNRQRGQVLADIDESPAVISAEDEPD